MVASLSFSLAWNEESNRVNICHVHAFLDCPHGLTFGKKCSLRCIPGAKMSGGEGSVTCEEDGKWSAQSAFCVMTCPNPEIPEHSVPLAESNCIGSKRTFSPGVSCKFRCKPGYRVKDREDPGRRILKKRCTKSGWWTRPRCEPIVCPELTANLLMWYNCSDGNSLGSVCKNNCPGEEVCIAFLCFIRLDRFKIGHANIREVCSRF